MTEFDHSSSNYSNYLYLYNPQNTRFGNLQCKLKLPHDTVFTLVSGKCYSEISSLLL